MPPLPATGNIQVGAVVHFIALKQRDWLVAAMAWEMRLLAAHLSAIDSLYLLTPSLFGSSRRSLHTMYFQWLCPTSLPGHKEDYLMLVPNGTLKVADNYS